MKNKEVRPDPESSDYRQKEALIADIKNASSLVPFGVRLLNLGGILAANPLLSNKQRGILLSVLNDTGLLHYHQDYFIEAGRLENEGKKAPEVDVVQWFVEGNDRLQALVTDINAVEEQLLAEREHLGCSLIEQGVANHDSIEEILGMQPAEFRQSELYDRFLIEFLYGNFSEDDPLKIFAALQKVMQLGFAMGIRDARETKEREDEEWQYFFTEKDT